MNRTFDFIVFGATGFAGYHVVLTLARHVNSENKQIITYAIAGRNIDRLQNVLDKVAKELNNDQVKNIPRIKSDIEDYKSLSEMASKTKIVLNCVGPYRFFGEPVVKACIENGTSYVDICGEPIFLERMALLYNEQANKAGCYIVSACGFDCIPCDMGAQFAAKNFEGTLNSLEIYHQVSAPNGVKINFGTLQSAIHGLANQHELTDIRSKAKELQRKMWPKTEPKVSMKGQFFYNEDIKAWCIPFLGADNAVLKRSMVYNYEKYDVRPIQTQVYIGFSSIFSCLAIIIWGLLFQFLCKFQFGRYLFETYPELLTFGMFSRQGPSKLQLETSKFKTTVFGQGWANKKLKSNENLDYSPEDHIVCKVEGGEPGYVATSAMLVGSALTLLEDKNLLPEKSGVFTPASAFQNTRLIERLEKMNVKFAKDL